MNIVKSFCQLKMHKLRHLATLLTVLMFLTYGVCPVSTFILPPEADDTSKESTQLDTTSENLQPTQSVASSIKPGIGESSWLREFQNLEQQNIEASRGNESKESQSSKSATVENISPARSSTSSSKSKGDKPSRRGKKHDSPTGRSSMRRNSEVLTAPRENSKQMSPSIGYMSLEERIAAWLMANKKDNSMWSGHADEDESNPRHESDDASLLLHVDKVQNYGNTRSSYPYDEDQPPARGFGNSGGYLDDTLHAYHFNNDFMNNGPFPSFEGQEGFKNYMDMGKSQRPKGLGKDRSSSPTVYDKLEAKRNSNNDAAKLHFAYYYDPESHYGSPDMKPPYPFFDKQYGMDEVFPFDGIGTKEKKPQHPKNTRKSQSKEHENNSFFTLENYVEDSAANGNDALNRESKNVKVNVPRENKSKPPVAKQPGANKKANNQTNAAHNAKKTKAKVENKDSRALNNSRKTGSNNDTKIDMSSSNSNSSLNTTTKANVSANSKDSAVRNQDSHTELEELLKGDVQNRSDAVESKNGTSNSAPSSIQTANITSFVDMSKENKTSFTSVTASKLVPESAVKNENNSLIQRENTDGQINNSIAGESISSSNLTVQSDSRLREAKQETALSQNNDTNLEKVATNLTDSNNATESKSNATKVQMSTSDFNQTTQVSTQVTPTYSEPNRLTTTEPSSISQKNVTGDMSFNHKEPISVAAAKNATVKDVLEIKSNSTPENISVRSDGLVNESTSYSHRNSSSFKTSEVQGDKLVTLNETWNLQIVNATDLRASVLASTGTNETVVDELLSAFSTAREQKNSDVKPSSTTEAPMKQAANVTLGDKPNTFTTSTDSVGSKNVEQRSKSDDSNYEKVFVSSSNSNEFLSAKEVLFSKQNETGTHDPRSGNNTHIASLLEVVGGDTKIEELAPKGTEREEQSILSEHVKTQVSQHQNKTEPEIMRNSEEVLSRLELLNVTTDMVHKVNESSVTSAVFMNKSTTTDSSLSGDRPIFEIIGNSTLTEETAFNSSTLINSLAARTADQKSMEPSQALEPNHVFNSSQSNQTNANITLNTLATAENASSSLLNSTKDDDNSTNTASKVEVLPKTVAPTNGDILSHLALANSLNISEPASSAQHKSLTPKLSSDSNVSRSLFSLDKEVLVNGTKLSTDRAVTKVLTSQELHANSSTILNKSDTLGRLLSGNRLESFGAETNSTAESKQSTSMDNHTASNMTYTSAESSGPTTTASDILLLPEALPNSEVLVGKQLDNHKPQLENIGNTLQAFSNSPNDSMPNNSNQTSQSINTQNTDGREKHMVENVKVSNSSLHSSVSSNVTDANSKLLNHEGKADSPKSSHSLNDSSSVNKGSISSAASANAKDTSENSTSDALRRSNNASLTNNTWNDDSNNETSALRVGGVTSHELQDVNGTIASLQRRSADEDPKVFTAGGNDKTQSALNDTRNSSAEAGSFKHPDKLQQLEASLEDDIPPISVYMVQDFSLRKVTPETKNTKDNGTKSKDHTAQGSDKAKVDSKQGAANDSAPLSNITSRAAAEVQCSGPACDLAPLSAVSRSQAAVSAVLTTHFGPAKDIMVPFDLELLDLADNYDNSTGMFICTVPGTYVISLYLMSHPGAKVNARIFVNNRPIAALWADDSKNAGFYPSSSTQTIAQLGFGDQVYVMLVDGGYGESWVHANYNVFTIFLLYEQVF